MMDEACLNVGNTADKQLLDAMDSQLAQSKYYSSKKDDGGCDANLGRFSGSSPISSADYFGRGQVIDLS